MYLIGIHRGETTWAIVGKILCKCYLTPASQMTHLFHKLITSTDLALPKKTQAITGSNGSGPGRELPTTTHPNTKTRMTMAFRSDFVSIKRWRNPHETAQIFDHFLCVQANLMYSPHPNWCHSGFPLGSRISRGVWGQFIISSDPLGDARLWGPSNHPFHILHLFSWHPKYWWLN